MRFFASTSDGCLARMAGRVIERAGGEASSVGSAWTAAAKATIKAIERIVDGREAISPVGDLHRGAPQRVLRPLLEAEDGLHSLQSLSFTVGRRCLQSSCRRPLPSRCRSRCRLKRAAAHRIVVLSRTVLSRYS